MKVFAKSGANIVKQVSDREFEIRTTALPAKGEANQTVVKLLAKHFKIAKSKIEIVGGKTTRQKMIDIDI